MKKIHTWRHTGFSVHQEVLIDGHDRDSLEGLAQYIGRTSLSEEKMVVKDGSNILVMSQLWG